MESIIIQKKVEKNKSQQLQYCGNFIIFEYNRKLHFCCWCFLQLVASLENTRNNFSNVGCTFFISDDIVELGRKKIYIFIEYSNIIRIPTRIFEYQCGYSLTSLVISKSFPYFLYRAKRTNLHFGIFNTKIHLNFLRPVFTKLRRPVHVCPHACLLKR